MGNQPLDTLCMGMEGTLVVAPITPQRARLLGIELLMALGFTREQAGRATVVEIRVAACGEASVRIGQWVGQGSSRRLVDALYGLHALPENDADAAAEAARLQGGSQDERTVDAFCGDAGGDANPAQVGSVRRPRVGG